MRIRRFPPKFCSRRDHHDDDHRRQRRHYRDQHHVSAQTETQFLDARERLMRQRPIGASWTIRRVTDSSA